MYINRLKNIITQHRFTFKKVSEVVGKSESWFHFAAKNNTFQVKDVLAICDWLNVPITDVFKDELREYKTIREDDLVSEPLLKYNDMKNEQLILAELKKLNERMNRFESELNTLKQSER